MLPQLRNCLPEKIGRFDLAISGLRTVDKEHDELGTSGGCSDALVSTGDRSRYEEVTI
jgi:hypothetical protein